MRGSYFRQTLCTLLFYILIFIVEMPLSFSEPRESMIVVFVPRGTKLSPLEIEGEDIATRGAHSCESAREIRRLISLTAQDYRRASDTSVNHEIYRTRWQKGEEEEIRDRMRKRGCTRARTE